MTPDTKTGFTKVEFNSYAQMLDCEAKLYLSRNITDLKPLTLTAMLVPDHYLQDEQVRQAIEDAQNNSDLDRSIEEIAAEQPRQVKVTLGGPRF